MITTSTFDRPVLEQRESGVLARWFPAVARVLLGLPMVVFGLNGFFNFIPPPAEPLAPGAEAFSLALIATGYMMPLIGATQLIAGALLVVNRFVPLALALLAPFFVNSIAFHVFLERTGLVPALVFLALEVTLLWTYRRAYSTLFVARMH